MIPTNEVQDAILAALKADAQLTALIPRAHIYPPQAPNKPQRPFILYGSAITTPRKVDGGDCADVSVAVHCFADAINGQINDPRAFATNVAAHIARILDELDVDIGALPGDTEEMGVKVYVQQQQVMNDGDPASWHSFVTVRAEAS